jgi:hypothetical protein
LPEEQQRYETGEIFMRPSTLIVIAAVFITTLSPAAHAGLISTSAAAYGEPGQALDFQSEPIANSATATSGGSVGLASGSLATGLLGAYTQAQAPFTFVEQIPSDGGIASATTNFSETLHLQGVLAAPQTVTQRATIEGTLSLGAPAFETHNAPYGPVSGWFNWMGSSELSPGVNEGHIWASYSDPAFCPSVGAFTSCHVGTNGAFALTLSLETLVDDLHRDVSFSGQLGAYSVWGSVANISSRLSVLLPEGLSYTSDSGFLSDVPAAVTVPEPSMATLLLIAAVAFTLVVRGKGKRRALL